MEYTKLNVARMNRLDKTSQKQVIAALVEGNSLRATARMTGVARMTIERLLVDVGAVCAKMQDEKHKPLKYSVIARDGYKAKQQVE